MKAKVKTNGMHMFYLRFRVRYRLSLVLCMCMLFSVSLWAQSREVSYGVRLAAIGGGYDTDLEPRWRGDRFFASLLEGGFGMSTPWENKAAGGALLGLRLYYKDFSFFLDTKSVSASPSWMEFSSISASTTPRTTLDFMNMDIERRDTDLGVSYTFYRTGEHSFFGKIFYRTRMISGDTGGLGLYSGSTASVPVLREGGVEADASGPGYGLGYSYRASNHEVVLGLSAYSLAGNWAYSQNYWTQGFIILFSEDGNYQISGGILDLGYRYYYSKNWRFFVEYVQDTASVADSDVFNINLSLTTNSAPTSTFNVFAYLGSAATDTLSTLELGVEYLF